MKNKTEEEIIHFGWEGVEFTSYPGYIRIKVGGINIKLDGLALSNLRHMTQLSQLGYSLNDDTLTEFQYNMVNRHEEK